MIYYKCLRLFEEISLENGIQVINADMVAGKEHLEHAINQAIKAFNKGRNIAKNILLEVLVRLSGQRQIRHAIDKFGIKPGVRNIVIISKDKSLIESFVKKYKCKEDEDILKVDEEKYKRLKEIFGIEDSEIEAFNPKNFEEKIDILKKLIIERIALLNLD